MRPCWYCGQEYRFRMNMSLLGIQRDDVDMEDHDGFRMSYV